MIAVDLKDGFSTVKSFDDAILPLAKKFKNIVVLNADPSGRAAANNFSKFFSERYFSLGLQEANMTSCASGFTVRGKVPFITGFSSFILGKAWEQIRTGVCYPNLNVKIVGTSHGLFSGEDGAGSHSLEDLALMRVLPNMKIVCPADYYEAVSAVEAAYLNYGPVYLRLSNFELPFLFDESYRFEFGKGRIVREGSDVCIFTLGIGVVNSLLAADLLAEQGISAMVVNLASVKPLDVDLVLDCASKVKKCFTVEDHNIIGGLGSAVAEVLGAPLVRIGMEDRFGESGKVGDLFRKHGLDSVGIFERVRATKI